MAAQSIRVGDLTARDVGYGIKVVLPDDNALDGHFDRVTGILLDYDVTPESPYTTKYLVDLRLRTYKDIDVAISGLEADFLVTIYGQ